MINILNLKFVILLEYQKIKIFIPSWSEEVFMIKKVEQNMLRTYIINDLYREELQKTNQKEFGIEIVIKRKGDKLYVKWKRYSNSFNIWIDKYF